jgi:hypothetical protein
MRLLRNHFRVLALRLSPLQPLPFHFKLSLIAAHLLGLTVICRLAHWPFWVAPLLLLGFCLPQLVLRRWAAETLAPLWVVYAFAILRLFVRYGLKTEVPATLDYKLGLAISGVWTGLIVLRAFRRLRYVWIALATGMSALMIYLVWLNLPAGVTGSDPFAYVQMGLDLAQHGTPLHQFPLAPFAENLGLPTLPTTHVGYVLPNPQGLAPTVWPPGYSVLLALVYRLGGEGAMFRLNVWLSLLSLILTFALAVALCPPRWRRLPLFVGMGAVTALATSFAQFTATAIPMADIAAQLFTTLTVVFTLRAACPRQVPHMPTYPHTHTLLGALTGLLLAAAFSVRYTQLLIGPGIMLMAWFGLKNVIARRAFLLGFIVAALIGVAPDMGYRAKLYGAPWRFGSGELALFSFNVFPQAVSRLSKEFFSALEFGWLWPLLVIGILYGWRRNRFALLSLALTHGSLLTFHLWYPYVRLRDLLSLYPPLAALTALGGAVVILSLWHRGAVARLVAIVGMFAVLLLRLAPLWGLRESGFFTFGYLFPEQRRAFDSIAVLTESEAVIACSLNSGAVELYGQRQTVRPGTLLQPGLGWSEDQWLQFVAALRAEDRPLYLLRDSPEMDEPLAALRDRYTLTRVADLDVPVYYLGGGSRNLRVPLYRVE